MALTAIKRLNRSEETPCILLNHYDHLNKSKWVHPGPEKGAAVAGDFSGRYLPDHPIGI